MKVLNLPMIPLNPPPFIMQFDYPVDKGVDLMEGKINSSGRLITVYGGRGDTLTFVLEAFGSEISITSIRDGFTYDKFFGPYGGDLDMLPKFYTDIFKNLEETTDKTSFYVELPKKMDEDTKNRELLIVHLTSILGGFCDYLPNVSDSIPLNKEDGNIYVKQAKKPEEVLSKIEELILSCVNSSE